MPLLVFRHWRKHEISNWEAKQNKVGTKERQVFFIDKAKQNEIGGKEWLDCLALMLEQKRDNRVTLFLQLYFVSLHRWWRFVFLFLQPFLCFTFLWQKYLLSFCSKRLIYLQTIVFLKILTTRNPLKMPFIRFFTEHLFKMKYSKLLEFENYPKFEDLIKPKVYETFCEE